MIKQRNHQQLFKIHFLSFLEVFTFCNLLKKIMVHLIGPKPKVCKHDRTEFDSYFHHTNKNKDDTGKIWLL